MSQLQLSKSLHLENSLSKMQVSAFRTNSQCVVFFVWSVLLRDFYNHSYLLLYLRILPIQFILEFTGVNAFILILMINIKIFIYVKLQSVVVAHDASKSWQLQFFEFVRCSKKVNLPLYRVFIQAWPFTLTVKIVLIKHTVMQF